MAKRQEDLPEIIHHKVKQHLQADKAKRGDLFFGMGMFGAVGWAITIPTVLGVFLGRWLDTLHEGQMSWTLTCLLSGLAIGCLVAWRWISKEGDRK
ncbi:MAG: AtpZ/AtpI family protein [Spirochaetales bacterium]|jgi:ATP synthase protein I|nr:AtpZ/AtpI family protein [Spirochaetales bacterium]